MNKNIWLDGLTKGFECFDRTKSTEAFFGKKSPLALAFTNRITEIKEVYDDIKSKGIMPKAVQLKYQERYKTILANLEKDLISILNIDKCSIGLIGEANAFAYPMCWDRNLVKRDPKDVKKRIFNKELSIQLYDIVEESNGFRFRKPTNKSIISALGLGLFDKKLSIDEVVAIMLHEIGHCFQQLLVDINVQVVDKTRQTLIFKMFECLNFIQIFIEFGMQSIMITILNTVLYAIMFITERDLSFKSKVDVNKLGEELIKDMFDKEYDREMFEKELKSKTDLVIKSNTDNDKIDKEFTSNIFAKIILGLLIGIMKLTYFIMIPFIPTNAILKNANLLIYNRFLQKNKRYEEFSDMFATSYGYGAELSSALRKIDRIGSDIQLYNWVHYIPIINVLIATGTVYDSLTNSLLNGYPMTRERIAGTYKTLDFELENNRDLSANDKKEIKAQMEEIKKEFMMYIDQDKLPYLCYRIYHKIAKTTIDKTADTLTITENVLQPLKELKEEMDNKKYNSYADLKKDLDEKVGDTSTNKLNFFSKLALSLFNGLNENSLFKKIKDSIIK